MTELPLSLPLHINLSPVQHLSDLTLMPSSAFYTTTNATSCPQNKMLAEDADWGASLVGHASYIAVHHYLPYTWAIPSRNGALCHIYSCSKMKWSVILETKTSVLLCMCVCLINLEWTCQVRRFYYTNLALLPLSFFWMLIIFIRNFEWKWVAV
jgi:hypothetical protein